MKKRKNAQVDCGQINGGTCLRSANLKSMYFHGGMVGLKLDLMLYFMFLGPANLQRT